VHAHPLTTQRERERESTLENSDRAGGCFGIDHQPGKRDREERERVKR
jgi:hypothetical protein